MGGKSPCLVIGSVSESASCVTVSITWLPHTERRNMSDTDVKRHSSSSDTHSSLLLTSLLSFPCSESAVSILILLQAEKKQYALWWPLPCWTVWHLSWSSTCQDSQQGGYTRKIWFVHLDAFTFTFSHLADAFSVLQVRNKLVTQDDTKALLFPIENRKYHFILLYNILPTTPKTSTGNSILSGLWLIKLQKVWFKPHSLIRQRT